MSAELYSLVDVEGNKIIQNIHYLFERMGILNILRKTIFFYERQMFPKIFIFAQGWLKTTKLNKKTHRKMSPRKNSKIFEKVKT